MFSLVYMMTWYQLGKKILPKAMEPKSCDVFADVWVVFMLLHRYSKKQLIQKTCHEISIVYDYYFWKWNSQI